MSQEYFLRELCKEDAVVINSWRADRELISKLGAGFRYIDVSVDARWLDSYMERRNNNVRLAVCCKVSKAVVGVVYLIAIDWLNRNCELAIMVGEKQHRGKGAGTYAIREALEHAFSDLNLHRVYLTVLQNNSPAISLYKKFGFIEEGLCRESVYKEGEYKNVISMACLRTDFHREQCK